MPLDFEFTLRSTTFKVSLDTSKFPSLSALGATVHKRWVQEAFEYMLQSEHGFAIAKTVAKYKNPETGEADDVIRLRFHNNACYKNDEQVIQWNPVNVTWFIDHKKTYTTRQSKLKDTGFDSALLVRPPDHAFTRGNPDYVWAVVPPAVHLFHEFGHRVQHLMKKPYMIPNSKSFVAGKEKRHFIAEHEADDGKVTTIYATDYTMPWEADNVSWNEIPMVKQLRALGICVGARWYYEDYATAWDAKVSDVALVDVNGTKTYKYQRANGTWYAQKAYVAVIGAAATSEVQIDGAPVLNVGRGVEAIVPGAQVISDWWKSGPGKS